MARLFVTPCCAIVLATLAGCQESDRTGGVLERDAPRLPDVHLVSTAERGPDPMDAAVHTAREDLDLFIAALQNPKPYQIYFSVKAPVPVGDEEEQRFEQIWLRDVVFEDGQFTGAVRDEPAEAAVHPGDQLTLRKDEVCDWMIIENDLLVGGFTIRAIRDQMSAVDRQRFDASFPFTIE